MDPNTALTKIRALIHTVQNAEQEDDRLEAQAELIERFEDLDVWLSDGGFPPREWVH